MCQDCEKHKQHLLLLKKEISRGLDQSSVERWNKNKHLMTQSIPLHLSNTVAGLLMHGCQWNWHTGIY